ncbi:polyprenyl synthetase family protein [Streptomyces antnestii]|uniref:polyprenyl synthetase family protein n=1 Tax=Streptomyces antnestii TaxID=2494256 RepID=UPI0016785BB5|nr:polyprenyl synthetase family protein [Streptomyces sp. San01]
MYTDIAETLESAADAGRSHTLRAAQIVTPALRATIDTLSSRIRPIVGYHFGWLDLAGQPTDQGCGKMVRAALTVLAAEACGGEVQRAVRGAVAVELVHNFSLLHDDVMDGDLERRGRPTVWATSGVPAAILAGDVLLARACAVLQNDSEHRIWATKLLTETIATLAEGQMADVAFERRTTISLKEALAVSEAKTAALLSCACELGAGLSGGGAEARKRLARFGWHLGMAFQLVDDLLGIWGDPAATGKPAGSDLRNRKKSIPVVAAMNGTGAAAEELAAIYRGEEPLTDDTADRAAKLIESAGGRAWTEAEIDRHKKEAAAQLEALGLSEVQRRPLLAIAEYVAFRNH